MNTNDNLICDTSIYDFLGKAGGLTLGKIIYEEAKALNVPCEIREVQQGPYTGKVMVYPKAFLQEFFKKYPKLKK